MKKYIKSLFALLMAMLLLAGCGEQQDSADPAGSEADSGSAVEEHEDQETAADGEEEDVQEEDPADEEDMEYEGDATSYYIDMVYTQQIENYYTAVSQQWNEGEYFENDMCSLTAYYYDGNALDNVGFTFQDLDNDGYWELIIGAIMGAEQDPAVFEIWTLVEDEPVRVAISGERNRYFLQYVEEDNVWYIANEAQNGADNSASYCLMLNEGRLDVMQGVVFDYTADAENPWFMTYDTDEDVSNDTPISEETALSVIESNRNHYVAVEYIPYSLYS